jgi:hypothetical protein
MSFRIGGCPHLIRHVTPKHLPGPPMTLGNISINNMLEDERRWQ